jgi:hypothetical protein
MNDACFDRRLEERGLAAWAARLEEAVRDAAGGVRGPWTGVRVLSLATWAEARDEDLDELAALYAPEPGPSVVVMTRPAMRWRRRGGLGAKGAWEGTRETMYVLCPVSDDVPVEPWLAEYVVRMAEDAYTALCPSLEALQGREAERRNRQGPLRGRATRSAPAPGRPAPGRRRAPGT